MFIKYTLILLNIALALILSGCGGGGTIVSEGGMGGSGISKGTVTGFGSIYVNGIKFDTTNSSYTSNGVVKSSQSHLRKGMVVTVQGEINDDGVNGVANSVDYELLIDAEISIQTASSFTALNQTVSHDASLTLVDGARYEISGFYDDVGIIHATLVIVSESVNTETSVIRGLITSDDLATTGTFNLGDLIITPDTGISFSNVKVGDFVEVKGLYNNVNTLTATENIEIEDASFGISNLDDAELEGYILTSCGLSLPCNVNLNGQAVEITSSTTFNAGSSIDVKAGVEVEVEGSLVNGVLIANEVEFKNEIEVEVEVLNLNIGVNASGKKILIPTSLPTLEIIISNDGSTQFEAGISYLDPSVGNTINHFTFQGQMIAGKLIASQMAEGSAPDMSLHGAVESYVLNTSITIAGQTINTIGINIKLDDNTVAGKVIPEAEFYDAISKNNVIVELSGVLNGVTINWMEMKLKL